MGKGDMGKLFASATFQTFGVPIVFVVTGILAKGLGLRDGDSSPKRNLCAIATSVFLMSFGTILTDMRKADPPQIPDHISWAVVILVLLFASVQVDRYVSWVRDANGRPTDCKHMFWGIFLPDVVSIFIFALYRLNV